MPCRIESPFSFRLVEKKTAIHGQKKRRLGMSWPAKGQLTHTKERPIRTADKIKKSPAGCAESPQIDYVHPRICGYGIYRPAKRTPLRLPFRCRSHALSENHLISCSNVSNSLPEKNSFNVMPKPSHSFLIVTMPGFLLFPYKMLLTVDVDTPDTLAR